MADIRFRQAVEPLHVIDGAVVIAPGEVGAKQRIEMLLRVVRLSVFTLRRNMTTVGVGLDGAVGGGVFRSGFLCREPLGQRRDFGTHTEDVVEVLAAEIILPGNPAHWHLVPLCGSIEPRALHLVDRHHVLARDIIGDFLAGVWLRRFIGSRNRLFCVVSLRFCISLPEFC